MSNEMKPMDPVRFGNIVKGTRERYSLSRKQLAERAGLGPRTLAAIENGRRLPTEPMVKQLEAVFGFKLFMNEHREVTVRVGAGKAEIDELIAPLIEQLWIAGIRTTMSCQQDPSGCIFIRFRGSDDLQGFWEITVKDDRRKDQLFERMCPSIVCFDTLSGQEVLLGFPKEEALCWAYELTTIDFYMAGRELAFTLVEIDVLFPPQDLPIILRRVKDFNRTFGRDRNQADTSQGGVRSREKINWSISNLDEQLQVKRRLSMPNPIICRVSSCNSPENHNT